MVLRGGLLYAALGLGDGLHYVVHVRFRENVRHLRGGLLYAALGLGDGLHYVVHI